ncbi:MAG: nucleoside-diphosphate kinase [Iphinoe sp. HA4291-MV1]|jgi:nucleoside diphosphate kinase|nr:nucleoside-diphosphate kinase [Iphinoe sp. HA4291-MV1]
MIKEICQILKEMSSWEKKIPTSVWINKYDLPKDFTKNQFVVFLKPEATNILSGVDIQGVLQLVFDTFQRWKVEVGAVRVLTAEYLHKYQVIALHYGIINDISRRGYDAISEKAKKVLSEIYKSELSLQVEILGGHQFLERFPAVSPFALSIIADNIGIKKIAGGTYCLRLQIDGKLFLVLNPFHPFQLEFFTTEGHSILVMEGRSETGWSDLRQQLVGVTNPVSAQAGSIRRTLFERREELRLFDINQRTNGIHLSAGPLEGMVELQRFFSDPEKGFYLDFQETCFGRLLVSKGVAKNILTELARNLLIENDGHTISAFDLTEEMNASEAAEQLRGKVSVTG